MDLSLVSCVGNVRKVLTLPLVVGSGIRTPLRVLSGVRLWLCDKGSHVVFKILLHQEIVITIFVE